MRFKAYFNFTGIGLGLINPSSFIAVNSYFSSNRGRAVGLALAGTGIGQMLMPHVVRLLLDYYGFRGTILIMGALALNGVDSMIIGHLKLISINFSNFVDRWVCSISAGGMAHKTIRRWM